MGLIKWQDVGVGLDLFSAFSNGDSSGVCHALFPQNCCYLLCSSQGQLPTYDDSFRSVLSFVYICSAFGQLEASAVHLDKKFSIQSFL